MDIRSGLQLAAHAATQGCRQVPQGRLMGAVSCFRDSLLFKLHCRRGVALPEPDTLLNQIELSQGLAWLQPLWCWYS